MSSVLKWLRLCAMTVLFSASPLIGWAAIVSATDDCIVSWDPVTTNVDNLPASIHGYKVYVAEQNGETLNWGLPFDVPPSITPATTCKALGLNKSGFYALAVTAYNANFESPFSEIEKVILTISRLYLEIVGAPNLPFHGTTTQVTVWMFGEIPTTVELSQDGYPPFARWPSDTFLTLSPDGQSLTGKWCITSSCWSEVAGPHVLYAVATYADGEKATVAVWLNVAASVSSPP